jgi:hypothetical protein
MSDEEYQFEYSDGSNEPEEDGAVVTIENG